MISDLTEPDQESGSKDDVGHRKRGNPLVRMMRKMTKKADPEKKKNVTIEMLQPSRYKPSDLNQMAEDTKFTKSKLASACQRRHVLVIRAVACEVLHRGTPRNIIKGVPPREEIFKYLICLFSLKPQKVHL